MMHRLRYFLVAAEEGNFVRAANHLNLAPSALSRQIRHLEEELGVELFMRKGRSVELSRAGHFYLERVRRILDDVTRARDDLRSFAHGDVGQLTVGLQELSAMQDIVVRCVKEFRARMPACDLTLQPMLSALQMEGLERGLIDAGFVLDCPNDHSTIDHMNVCVNRWMIAMPTDHRLAREQTVSLRSLTTERFVGLRKYVSPEVHQTLFDACRAGGLNPNYVQYAESSHGLFALVATATGIAFVNTPLIPPTGVVVRDVPDLDVEIRLDLVWRRGDDRPMLTELIRTVQQTKAAATLI